QAAGVQPDVDGALAPALDEDLPHARCGPDQVLDPGVGELGQLAQRKGPGDGDGQDGHGVGVEIGDDGRVGSLGQSPQHLADFVANVLKRRVRIAFEGEGDADEGEALAVDRAQLLDPRDGVELLLDGLGDGGLDLLRTRTGEAGEDGDGGALHVRQEVDAEAAVGDGAQRHERRREHGGEDRPADADLGEVPEPCSARAAPEVESTFTWARSYRRAIPVRRSAAPSSSGPCTSASPPRLRRMVTGRSRAAPSFRTKTLWTPATEEIAVSGTGKTFSCVPSRITPEAKTPGRRCSAGFSKSASTGKVRELPETSGPTRETLPRWPGLPAAEISTSMPGRMRPT